MTSSQNNSAGELSEHSRRARGTQRKNCYGLGLRRGGRARFGDRSGVRRPGTAGMGSAGSLSNTPNSAGRGRGGSTMGRSAPRSQPAVADNTARLFEPLNRNITIPSGESFGSFDMSNLWSTLPRDSQPRPFGPSPSYSPYESNSSVPRRDSLASPDTASEAHLINRIESSLRNADNTTCLRLLEDTARTDHRLGALLLQSS
jgi:hypothetical protein